MKSTSDNTRTPGTIPPTSVEQILYDMNAAGAFQVSLLTSTEGLPIATVPATYDSDLTAAMVALIQRASNDAQSQLGMAEVDEVTICAHDSVRLVCRYIPIPGERLILAAMVPPDHSYRRVTNQAIKRIKRLLS